MDTVATIGGSWFESTPIITIIGATLVAVLSSVLTYYLTRKMRLEAEWRTDKLKLYQHLLNTLTETMSMPKQAIFNEVQKEFSKASNVVRLVAPQAIINILNRFHTLLENSPESTSEARTLLDDMMLEMRKDLRIRPRDNPNTLRARPKSPIYLED